MLVRPLVEAVLTASLRKIAPICKRQRLVLTDLFQSVTSRRGRANFVNLARFGSHHEQTFRRHFARTFDWLGLNLAVLRLTCHPKEQLIGVFDATFLPKSGTKTWGLDKFFCSAAKAVRTGLEVSLLGVVAVQSRRTIPLDAAQTPAGLSSKTPCSKNRMDFYLGQILRCLPHLEKVRYWVGDGNYAKRKMFDGLTGAGKHFVTKLRCDANLLHLARPHERASGGRPRKYAGKVDFGALSRFDLIGTLEGQHGIDLYTACVHSPHFGRRLRVVVLVKGEACVVLCSTDAEQPAEEIVAFYRLRYQLEFVIRDAKQYTGLAQCQARGKAKLSFHVSLSVAAVGVLRLVSARLGMSLQSACRQAYNEIVVGRTLEQLSLGAEFAVSTPTLASVLRLGNLTPELRWQPG